jgi:preprotein translocase subunit SecY
MLEILRNAWKIQDLRKRITYTLLMLFIFRVGSFVPVPGIAHAALSSAIAGNGLLAMLDLFNGGSLSNYTLFAAGITPYITASIVFQLLTMAIPNWKPYRRKARRAVRRSRSTPVTPASSWPSSSRWESCFPCGTTTWSPRRRGTTT